MALYEEKKKKDQFGRTLQMDENGNVIPMTVDSNSQVLGTLPKDNNQRYDPYAPGTPTMEAQGKMNDLAGRARDLLSNNSVVPAPVRAGFEKSADIGKNLATDAFNVVKGARENQKEFMATGETRDSRINNIAEKTQEIPQGGFVNLSPNTTPSQGGVLNMSEPQQQKTFSLNATRPSLTVPPQQQIGKPASQQTPTGQEQNQNYQPGQGRAGLQSMMGGVQSMMGGGSDEVPIPGPRGPQATAGKTYLYQEPVAPKPLTKEEATKQGIGGWKSRNAFNAQQNENYRTELALQDRAKTNETQASMANAHNAAVTGAADTRALGNVGRNIPQQQIAMPSGGGQRPTESPSDAQIRGLRDSIINAKTPEERKKAEDTYNAVMGRREPQPRQHQIVNQETEDPATGVRTRTPMILDESGNARPVNMGGAGQQQQAPTDPTQRVAGQTYVSPNGMLGVWDGKGWKQAGQ